MASAMAIVRSSVFALVLLAAVSQTHAQACNTTLLDAVLATPELSILAAVVNASGLSDTLAGIDNVTVIAPDNAAFNGTGGLLDLLTQNNLTLEQVTAPGSNRAASILLYHIIPAVASAAQLQNNQVLPTQLEGYTLTVRKSGSDVTIVGKANNATVVLPDVRVCNSIVHVVNRVLLPEASLTAIPVSNVTAGPSPAVPTPPGVPSPPSAVVPPPPGGGNSSAASTLGASSLVFGLSGAVAAALLL